MKKLLSILFVLSALLSLRAQDYTLITNLLNTRTITASSSGSGIFSNTVVDMRLYRRATVVLDCGGYNTGSGDLTIKFAKFYTNGIVPNNTFLTVTNMFLVINKTDGIARTCEMTNFTDFDLAGFKPVFYSWTGSYDLTNVTLAVIRKGLTRDR